MRHGPLALAGAVQRNVRARDTVYIGNFGAQLFCVGAELVRAGHTDLHLIAGSGGLLLDQLIGAGTARAVTFAHCWNPIGPQPAWNLRRAAEAPRPQQTVLDLPDPETPRPEIRELSLGMLGAAFHAAAWGLPFMPIPISPDTGYVTDGWSRDMIEHVACKFGEVHVVRAIQPDVAFVHAELSDADGNALIREPYGEHLIAAQAAVRTVVVAEEVLDAGVRLPEPANLAGIHVDEVVAVPGGVAPDGIPSRYPRDVAAYAKYGEESATRASFARWLARHREGMTS